MAVTVHGRGADVIVIEGDIDEEFTYQKPGYGHASGGLLGFSDGTILLIAFTQVGEWSIAIVVRGSADLTIEQGAKVDGIYSDLAVLDGDITWVIQGIAVARRES